MGNRFSGWYFKCQDEKQTIAVIPACHEAGGEKSCSLQLVTDAGAWYVPYARGRVWDGGSGVYAQIGGNLFSARGIRLDMRMTTGTAPRPALEASGLLRFGSPTPLKSDIMGPFRHVPFLQCRHRVASMAHTVNGALTINGTDYRFENALGYIEGDCGRSFPREYLWTQAFFKGGSLMLSVADIPMGAFRFTGIISAVRWQGKEYRLATYSGARLEGLRGGEVVVRQGGLRLTARLLERRAQSLRAPAAGQMARTIRESPACRAYYSLEQEGKPLFAFETPRASFEYEYPEPNAHEW